MLSENLQKEGFHHAAFSAVYNFLWADLFTIPLPGRSAIGISLLVLLLIPTELYFTMRTGVLPIRFSLKCFA